MFTVEPGDARSDSYRQASSRRLGVKTRGGRGVTADGAGGGGHISFKMADK